MENLAVTAAMWGIFMSVTLQAAVQQEKNYSENYVSSRIIETVVSISWETDDGSDRNYRFSSDRLSAANVAKDKLLFTDRAVQFATAKPYVFSE